MVVERGDSYRLGTSHGTHIDAVTMITSINDDTLLNFRRHPIASRV